MSIRKSGLDLVVLPAGMLSRAKSHLRIDGTYDDHYITTTLARSINWFERITEVSVNPVTYAWKPAYREFVSGAARVPVSPVLDTWTAAIAGEDATDAYEIGTDTIHGVEINVLIGTWADGLVVTMPSGYASADAIDPGIQDIVLRYAAHLYEHREILVPGVEAATPGWMTDVVSTWMRQKV